MAFNLSASPSTSLSHETHLFCNSLSPPNLSQLKTHKNLNFPLKKSPLRFSSKVSLQEPAVNAVSLDSEIPDEKPVSSSKSLWVNPKSARASKLKQKSYDYRFASFVKIAESLNSCNPVEEDISGVLDILGDKIVEQDAVIVLNNMSNTETAPLVLNYFQKRLKVRREVVLYNVTLKVFRKCKDLDGAINFVLCLKRRSSGSKRCRCVRCEPDAVTCSVMVDAYGRVGNADVALSLYDRARSEKWRLDAVTFSTLIRIYGSMGNFDGCLNLYEEMKALGVRPNASVYNSLLDAMGRAKRPWQAKNIYRDMVKNGVEPTWGYEKLGACTPDSWTFASLITLYSCSGKVEEAETTLNEMLEAGFEPNIFVLTSIIQCYGKAGRTDDVVRTFDRVLELGITPDGRLVGCLLNVITQAPKEELGKLTSCIEKAKPARSYRETPHQLERACELLDLGLALEIYTDIMSKTPAQWSLHLKSLSLGAALTALHIWMNDLSKALESGEEFPSLLGINTGHGKHKFSEKGLAGVFEAHLKELNAPFHEAPDKIGWFLTTKVAATSWLESRRSRDVVAAA
ncbi:hypothetical protein DH2020_033081 [Rehmannia glutinosa]|uniref:Smr domain-containing protein n=1 Tax=Rehmannia glutinosa TaxID=99300 RepID=A0ABR0VDL5_REHGL